MTILQVFSDAGNDPDAVNPITLRGRILAAFLFPWLQAWQSPGFFITGNLQEQLSVTYYVSSPALPAIVYRKRLQALIVDCNRLQTLNTGYFIHIR